MMTLALQQFPASVSVVIPSRLCYNRINRKGKYEPLEQEVMP